MAAPVARGQQRDVDALPVAGARAVVVVVERVRGHLGGEVSPVRGELVVGERLRPAGELARVGVDGPALPAPVLHRGDLHLVPVAEEGAQDPAVAGGVAVPVGGALPGAHRREPARRARGDVPLVHRVVGDAVQPDLAARPRLRRGPLDASREVAPSRAARTGRAGPASARRRANRRERRRSRRGPTSPDRPPPSSGGGWRTRPRPPDAGRPSAPTGSDSPPGRRAPWRTGRRRGSPGWRPSPSGRKTSARSTTPSSISIGTSQSICTLSRSSTGRARSRAAARRRPR